MALKCKFNYILTCRPLLNRKILISFPKISYQNAFILGFATIKVEQEHNWTIEKSCVEYAVHKNLYSMNFLVEKMIEFNF